MRSAQVAACPVVLSAALALCLVAGVLAAPEEATITISATDTLGLVNPALFGNHVLPAGMGSRLLAQTPDGGYQLDPAALELVQALRPGLLRFGRQAIFEDAIGPQGARHGPRCGWPEWATFEYGIDEHMALLEAVGAPGQALVLVGYPIALERSGDPGSCVREGMGSSVDQMVKRAMAWVAYANAMPGDKTVIGVDEQSYDWGTAGDWAGRRAANGHPEPYGIRYWEIGNEVYFIKQPRIAPSDYARHYLAFREAMRRVDPTIRVGASARLESRYDEEWNVPLLETLDGQVDALVLHTYYPDAPFSPDLDQALMAASTQADRDLARLRKLIRAYVEEPEGVELFLGENGVLYAEEDPVAWNRVVTAVYDADLIGLLVQRGQDYNLALAVQHWLHGPSPTADIHFDYTTGERYVRPDYYALQLWTQHFGEVLVRSSVESPVFDLPARQGNVGPLEGIPYLAAHASISPGKPSNPEGRLFSTSEGKLYLMVINRHLLSDMAARIRIEGFELAPIAKVYVLNGESVDANNEAPPHDAVVTRQERISNAGQDFVYVFPAHSVTAIEFAELHDSANPGRSQMALPRW